MTSNDFQQVNQKALRYLSYREHSRLELKQKLQSHTFEPDVIDAVLTELATQGYQSDLRFAESYTRYRIGKGYGTVYIKQVLRQRGIEQHIIMDVLAEYESEGFRIASDVRSKRFGETLPENTKDYAKQMRFLQYRGFTSEQIRHALQTIPKN